MCRICDKPRFRKYEWRDKHILVWADKIRWKYHRETPIAKKGRYEKEKLSKKFDHYYDRWPSHPWHRRLPYVENRFNFWHNHG